MSIGKRQRFRVLRRDGFKCRYCGAVATSELLEVDHVIPKSSGGPDTDDNLVTACVPCNRGKADKPLAAHAPQAVSAEAIRAHAEQVRAVVEAQAELDKERRAVIDYIADQWRDLVGSDPLRTLYAGFYTQIEKHPLSRIIDAIRVVGSRGPTRDDDRARYFYGVLRRMADEDAATRPSAIEQQMVDVLSRREMWEDCARRLGAALRGVYDQLELEGSNAKGFWRVDNPDYALALPRLKTRTARRLREELVDAQYMLDANDRAFARYDVERSELRWRLLDAGRWEQASDYDLAETG